MFTIRDSLCVFRMSEAEVALTGNIFQRLRSSPEDLVNDFGEVAPFTFHLLAKIYRYLKHSYFGGLSVLIESMKIHKIWPGIYEKVRVVC